MALPDTIRDQDYTALVWADTTDYSSTVSGLVQTHQIDLTSLADAAARQGAKADLTAARGPNFMVFAGIEADVAPTAGELIEIYWAESPHATAGNANPGGTSGADAAYTGTACNCQRRGVAAEADGSTFGKIMAPQKPPLVPEETTPADSISAKWPIVVISIPDVPDLTSISSPKSSGRLIELSPAVNARFTGGRCVNTQLCILKR